MVWVLWLNELKRNLIRWERLFTFLRIRQAVLFLVKVARLRNMPVIDQLLMEGDALVSFN